MKPAEMRGMSDEQLVETLRETEKHLFQLRFQAATDRLEAPSELLKAKKDIARIKTVQRAKELAKLAAAPDAELAKQAAALEPKTEGPGKRRSKRAVARIAAIQEARAATAAKPATPAKKGK